MVDAAQKVADSILSIPGTSHLIDVGADRMIRLGVLRLDESLYEVIAHKDASLLHFDGDGVDGIFVDDFEVMFDGIFGVMSFCFSLLAVFENIGDDIVSELVVLQQPLLHIRDRAEVVAATFLVLCLFVGNFLFLLLSEVLFLLLKVVFFLLKVFFQQIILLFECCDILSIVDQSLQCSFDIHIYNRLNSFIE